MTKQHFELVARVIKSRKVGGYGEDVAQATLNLLAYEFADAFADANPRFDRARFLKACGVE